MQSFNAARYSFDLFWGQHLKKLCYLMACEVRYAVFSEVSSKRSLTLTLNYSLCTKVYDLSRKDGFSRHCFGSSSIKFA